MSTRCQVRVEDGESKLTLYHHTDGYPSYMLMLIQKAWEKYCRGWEGARVGKAASALCAVDPLIFEPLDYHTLHGDIEWFYTIDVHDTKHIGTTPVWKISVYKTSFDFEQSKSEEERTTLIETISVDAITGAEAGRIEKSAYKDKDPL